MPPLQSGLPSLFALPTVQEGHGSARHAGATRAADTVDVVIGTWGWGTWRIIPVDVSG